MQLAYHLFAEREGLYTSSSSDGHDPGPAAFPLSVVLPCIRFYSCSDAEANRWVRWKMNPYLEQLRTMQRKKETCLWHSQMPGTLVSRSECFGSAAHFALTLLSLLMARKGCSCCLFVWQEQEVALLTDPPSSLASTGHPFNESLYYTASSLYARQDKGQGKR